METSEKGVRKKRIPLSRPFFDSQELDALREVLESRWVSRGERVRDFEEAVSGYLGGVKAVSAVNCTAALQLALLAIGIKPGEDVLVADYTFPAAGHAVMHCGARPVFVDVRADDFNIDPELIAGKVTKKSRALIVVHAFGFPADMDRIVGIASACNLPVIEDAACALGARYRGRFAGTIASLGCYSFHGRKNITTGEGGMVVSADSELAGRVRRLSLFGAERAFLEETTLQISEFLEAGFNYKISELTAALGLVQLRKNQLIIARKRELARYWNSRLDGIPWLKTPRESADCESSWQSYVIRTDSRKRRDGLIRFLAEAGVEANIGTYASHLQPVYQSTDACPVSRELFDTALSLPLFYELELSEIDYMAELIEKFRARM